MPRRRHFILFGALVFVAAGVRLPTEVLMQNAAVVSVAVYNYPSRCVTSVTISATALC